MPEKEVANVFAKLADDDLLSPDEPQLNSQEGVEPNSGHEVPAGDCSDDCVEVNISQKSNSTSVQSLHVSSNDKHSQSKESDDNASEAKLRNEQFCVQLSDGKDVDKQLGAESITDSAELEKPSLQIAGSKNSTSNDSKKTGEVEGSVSAVPVDNSKSSKNVGSSKFASKNCDEKTDLAQGSVKSGSVVNTEDTSADSREASVPDLLMECEVEEEGEEGEEEDPEGRDADVSDDKNQTRDQSSAQMVVRSVSTDHEYGKKERSSEQIPSNAVIPTEEQEEFANDHEKIMVFVDIELEDTSEKSKKPPPVKKYVCGYCSYCRQERCSKCFSCKQHSLERRSEVWSLIRHHVQDFDQCQILCQDIQQCQAFRTLIEPALSAKYISKSAITTRDMINLSRVVPLCHPIPPHSCIAGKVVVILAIQHVMRALQEQQRAVKGLSKLPPYLRQDSKPSTAKDKDTKTITRPDIYEASMETSVKKRGRPQKSPKRSEQHQPPLGSHDRRDDVDNGDSSGDQSDSGGSEKGVSGDGGRLRRRPVRNDDSSSDSDFSPHNAAARKSLSNVKERTRWSQRKREPKRSSFYKSAAKRRNKGDYSSDDDSSEDDDINDNNDADHVEKEKKKKSGGEEEKEDDGDDETSSDAFENILEASMEDLKQMQEIEIHEAIRLGALKSRTRLRPEMFSETFQLKVGKLLADGCNLKALSDKLDLSPDTLRSWRRLHEHKVVELKQRQNDKKKKKKQKYKERQARDRTISQNSSLTKEILEQVKQISVMPSGGPSQLQKILPRSSEDQNYTSNLQSTTAIPSFHTGQSPVRGSRKGHMPPSSPGGMIKQLIHKVSSSGKHMFTTATIPASEVRDNKHNGKEGKAVKGSGGAKSKSKPETNVIENIHILDKGASDVSSEESDFDDDVLPKPVMQDSLPFLCND